jgi:TrmH family RNA methyltransferase
MPSNAEIKQFSALRMPKYRQKYGQFVVEGRKQVLEVFHSDYAIDRIMATEEVAAKLELPFEPEIISRQDYQKISQMETPPGICAVVRTRHFPLADFNFDHGVTLALDGISDPGNLGTIMRTADWFGYRQVLLSNDCTDVYNAKCLAATMGSFTRMKWHYCDLPEVIAGKNVLGCFMDGVPVEEAQIDMPAILLVGSEAHGIRAAAEETVKLRVSVSGDGKTESLNAAMAAGMVMHMLFLGSKKG